MTSQDHRVLCGKPRYIAREWRITVEQWAGQRGIPYDRALDLFEEVASLKLYCGADWDTAQAEAWAETIELLRNVA